MVVAQRAVLDVDFAHDAHLHALLVAHRDGLEGLDHPAQVLVDLLLAQAATGGDLVAHVVAPVDAHPVGLPRVHLIGAHLVGEEQQHIAINQPRQRVAQQLDGDLEPQLAVLVQSGQVQRNHRHLLHALLLQRLAQQMDVVAGAAAASGLGDHQRRAVQVVLATLQRVDHLADDQQRRVASVVVDALQSALHHAGALVV